MNLKEKYLLRASGLEIPGPVEKPGSVVWQSPSNIALIKYWGKKEDQIPQNPSFSFTLSKSFTETEVNFSASRTGSLELEFLFEGVQNPAFEGRIRKFLDSISKYLPFLNYLRLDIRSHNSFPHSSGIASSASAMSSLALCLVDIENSLFKTLADPAEFLPKAAFLARLGSGSATRSVYGGFVAWGKTSALKNAVDEAGVPYTLDSSNSFTALKDAILITSTGKKNVSSTHGHEMMIRHPWAEARYAQAHRNLERMDAAIRQEKDEDFVRIIESEALSLHALMLSSDPGYRLMNENTWKIIEHVRDFREKSGLFIAFTLDAGPNVHLVYRKQNNDQVQEFIHQDLLRYCEDGKWIDDEIGEGPVKLK